MSIEDRTRWEQRHRLVTTRSPRPAVLELPPASSSAATALDVACGQGRHTDTLRLLGYRVVGMDVAMTALRHLRSRGSSANGSSADEILAIQADTDDWPFAPSVFDVIVQVDFLERSLFPRLRESLRSGGLLMVDTFLNVGGRNAEGPSRPDFLLSPGELPATFVDFEILRYHEDEGATARAVFLGRKP